ncbi:adhesive plaque matrix protein-like isoform X2 [Tachysurus fulvidraco]|uniref:adhesive plaque matrix protein-like isoform X2 n=1 Tax=Tachysurus fulvidraco TaxID=1234273 RepID=UPI000F50A50C|nr:adhesive plaque matrix protein-like isoform X2 [Tachysurus fulvidraco]
MFQQEETVHYVPATLTPDFQHVSDNVYPMYNPEYQFVYQPVYYPVYYPTYYPEYDPEFYPEYDPEYNPVFQPVYYPEYYQILPQDFYPQPPMVETVEEDCIFSSPELSQNQQPNLPERKPTLITNQDNNDDGQDIMVKELQRGTAMYEPEILFPGENVSVPQHVSPPEPASPPEPVSPPEHKPAYMIPNTKQEETVHYVPATNTPDSAHTDNIYPMYNPEYYQVLPPDVYPQPPMVETVEDDCFLTSPQLPQFLQPFLPERKHSMITNQDPNDDGEDILDNNLLGDSKWVWPWT